MQFIPLTSLTTTLSPTVQRTRILPQKQAGLANSTNMSQQALIDFEMPKSVPGPQSDDNTRATGLRNFLKGEVITVNSDSDDDEHMNTAVPAMKRLNVPTHQETGHRVPEGVHPSRIKNHTRKDPDPTTWREQKMEQELANWAPTGNNKIPLPVNTPKTSRPPCSVLAGYGTGSNRNVPGQGPPKAPKAMISQGGKARFNPAQGVEKPPTGPGSGTAPRKSGAAKGNRSVGHLMGTPRRKKYIAARKLLLRKNDPSAVPAVKNSGSSYPPSALPKVDTCRDIPVARHSTPLRMQSPGHREKDVFFAKPSTSQLPSPQLKPNPRNGFNNLTPTVDYNPKYSAVDPQYALFRDSVTPDQDTAPWDKQVRVPQVPSSKVAGTADISLENGHQVHHTRLNHFNPHYSTSPEPDRYLSPPIGVGVNDPTRRNVEVGPYKDGDIVGGGAGRVPATSRGRQMLEKMGYKPGVSLGRSGKEELELAVVTMKIGKRGLGARPKGWVPEGRVLAAPPGLDSLVWAGNTTPVEKQDEVQSGLESSNQKILEAEGTGSKPEPSETIAQDNGDGIDSSSGGGTKERVVITIDSDDDDDHVEQEIEEERAQEVLPRETQQRQQQKDEKAKKENQDPAVMGESEVEYDPEDVEMGDTHDYVVNPPCHDPRFVQAEQTPTRILHQNPGTKGPTCRNTKGQPVEDTSFKSNATVSRWKLPPFRYSSSSCRPTVPMQLLGLVIIERLEQVALVEIFHCISAFEEDYRLTDPAFNHVLAKSFLKVRDMFMRDPLLDVDQEICEGIVKEEFGALLEHLETSSSHR